MSRYCFPIIFLNYLTENIIYYSIPQTFHWSLTLLDNQRRRNLVIGDPIHLTEDMKPRCFGASMAHFSNLVK